MKSELRQIASDLLLKIRRTSPDCSLLYRALPPGPILSFAPCKGEIDVTPLNARLAEEGRLGLPRVEGSRLALYQVAHLLLVRSPWGILEPPAGERPLPLSHFSAALIPGLLFDTRKYRLGRGGGFYDRLLQEGLPFSSSFPVFGVGFHEQLVSCLPTDSWDVPLTALFLF